MNRYSYSQIAQFLSCQHKWYVRYVLGWERVEMPRPMKVGQAAHDAIAGVLLGTSVDDSLASWLEKEEERLQPAFESIPAIAHEWDEEIRPDIEETVPWVVKKWIEFVKPDEWETVETPKGPLVEMKLFFHENFNGSDIVFVFVPDWVARHKPTGLTWLIDWKTSTSMPDEHTIDWSLQKMLYQHILAEFDIEVHGSRLAYIKSTRPKTPQLTLKGTMSRAKITTDWPTYKAAVEEAGLDPADYEDMKPKFDTTWCKWYSVHRTRDICRNAWYDIAVPAMMQMNALYEKGLPIRHPGVRTCGQCPYELPCTETLRGHEIDWEDYGYTQREETT